jgi:hypothetical protein
MDNTELEKHIIDIMRALSRLDVKISSLCDYSKETRDDVKKLPCEEHTQVFMNHLNNKVPFRIFMWVIGIIIMLTIGSYSFTNHVDHDLHAHIESTTEYQNEVTE